VTSDADRLRLLEIARHAITAHTSGAPPPDFHTQSLASRRGGAFVSLHKAGELRGCIGHLEADELLTAVVARCAVAAGSADPRFPALVRAELSLIQIEISLLGAFEPIVGPADLEIGRHGLLVEHGRQRGLLLPQVAVEHQLDREAFLRETCHKAGLAGDAWKDPQTRIYGFTCEVIRENR